MGKRDNEHSITLRCIAPGTFWLVQAIWGGAMLLPLLLVKRASLVATARTTGAVYLKGWPGLGIAAIGFVIEAFADAQKFSAKSGGNGGLVTNGLYSIVQYPNYSGEIMFWLGMGYYWYKQLEKHCWLAFLPAAFVSLLLIKVSGIPLSERSRAKRFAQDAAYKSYNAATKWLIPGIY
jgi:steroid 5-alpha reductase family enzyme